jgi:hypothetical protein
MLKFFVCAVAKWRRGAVLAAAEVDGLGLGSFEFYRREAASLVAAIAERLIGALAAGTPEVALAGFDGNGIGGLLWDGGIWHGWFSWIGDGAIKAFLEFTKNCRESQMVASF